MVRRSGLTMPVVTARFIDKAWQRGCDFITIDLEDSVPRHLKAHARTLVKDAIPSVGKGGAEAFTRINHDTMAEDTEAVVWPGLKRIKYPKTEHAHEVRALDALITRLEKERGIEPGTIEIDASIETAPGVANVFEIASASPRVREFGATTGGYTFRATSGRDVRRLRPVRLSARRGRARVVLETAEACAARDAQKRGAWQRNTR
jgi:citrate lyase subunit beta/citryl-CoA lyase